jgi:NADH:flavin oxidoreductase / NADH oxidase family
MSMTQTGFDGIELHSANGHLLERFIRPNTNIRFHRSGYSTTLLHAGSEGLHGQPCTELS